MIAFKAIKITAPPIRTGQSNSKPELINNCPDPFIPKTFSRTAMPENATGNVVAIEVIISGIVILNYSLRVTHSKLINQCNCS